MLLRCFSYFAPPLLRLALYAAAMSALRCIGALLICARAIIRAAASAIRCFHAVGAIFACAYFAPLMLLDCRRDAYADTLHAAAIASALMLYAVYVMRYDMPLTSHLRYALLIIIMIRHCCRCTSYAHAFRCFAAVSLLRSAMRCCAFDITQLACFSLRAYHIDIFSPPLFDFSPRCRALAADFHCDMMLLRFAAAYATPLRYDIYVAHDDIDADAAMLSYAAAAMPRYAYISATRFAMLLLAP